MKQYYYYLVAGLPDLLRGEQKKTVPYEEIRREILQELSPEDRDIIHWICYRYDNSNILSLLTQKDRFDSRGIYSREILEFRMETREGLPSYISEFLTARSEEKKIYADLDDEEELSALYYRDLLQQDNAFIRHWAEFEINLHNFLGARTARLLDKPQEKSILPLNDSAEIMAKSTSDDFGLGSRFPWIEDLLQHADVPLKLEDRIDAVIWNHLEEFTEGCYFTVEVVAAFMIRLNTIQRWQNLDPERAKKKIHTLLNNIQSVVKIEKGK
jgi:hypothetical protein